MMVKGTNRSRRMIYLVVLLVFAVALSTALVLAGERNSQSHKKDAGQENLGAVAPGQVAARLS